MPYCSILDCKTYSHNKTLSHGGISYHRFPKDPLLKEKWINSTGRVNWFPSKTSTICSQHFREDDFVIKKSGNKYITDKSEPTINILSRHDLDVSTLSNIQVFDTAKKGKLLSSDPQYIDPEKGNQDISNNREISTLQTPKKLKLDDWKDTKIKEQNIKIKSLQARNRRLKKKNAHLQQILNAIEEKYCTHKIFWKMI